MKKPLLILIYFLLFALGASPPFAESNKSLSYRQAFLYASKGDFERTLQLLKEYTGKKEDSSEVLSEYIVILDKVGQFKNAVGVFNDIPSGVIISDKAKLAAAHSLRKTKQYPQAINIYESLFEKLSVSQEATINLFCAYIEEGKTDKAFDYLNKQRTKYKEKELFLRLCLAQALLNNNMITEADDMYNVLLKDYPKDKKVKLGKIRTLILNKKFPEAEAMINKLFGDDPLDIEAFFAKGELLEAQRDYLGAYKVYDKVLEIYPTSQIARNLKYRVLGSIGANSLAMEKLLKSKEEIDPEVIAMIKGNEPMQKIKWQEPQDALSLLEDNLNAESIAEDSGALYLPHNILRNCYDRILALRQKYDMEGVLKEYKKAKELENKFYIQQSPPWIRIALADAYLYLRKPEKALQLYEGALEEGWEPTNTKLSIYYTLVELGRYNEATKILNEIDSELPAQIINRGILKDNLQKEEVAVNRCWLLIYQDRFAEAQRLTEEELLRAPFDTNLRTALAHIYLFRGWPRLALEEFSIVRESDPKDIAGQIGYCYALDQNDRGEEARALAKELLLKFPENTHAKRLNKLLKVQDMPAVSGSVTLTDEQPSTRELSWTGRVEMPISPWRKIFSGFFRRLSEGDGSKDDIKRGFAGIDWRLNRDWWLIESLSMDTEGRNFGHSTNLTYNPNDKVSLSAQYDSYSLNVPLHARVLNIKAQEWNLVAAYRQSESFIATTLIRHLLMSDNNKKFSYTLQLDKAVTTKAFWKTRFVLEGNATTNTLGDAAYFNPKELYSLTLTPMIEHTWFRRYERSFTDRLYIGAGVQWQKSFSPKSIGDFRYEQDYKFSDTFSVLVGANFGRRNYDSANADYWSVDLASRCNF